MGFRGLGKRSFAEAFPESFLDLPLPFKRIRLLPPAMDVENVAMRDRRRRPFVRRPIGIRKSSYRRFYRSNRRPMSRFSGTTEWKYIDIVGNLVNADSTGVVALLNGAAEGVGPSQHVGRLTMMKSILLRCNSRVMAGTGVDQTQRVVLVYDRQPNGVALTWNDVFGSSNVYSIPDLDWRARFVILLDKKISLNASGESGSNQYWDFYKRVNLPVVYDQTAGATIASISTGSLYLMATGDVVAGATAGQLIFTSRVRFTDR